jgi:hypothetical protein
MEAVRILTASGVPDREIAKLAGCSPRTLQRRRGAAGGNKRGFTLISDDDLMEVINQLRATTRHVVGGRSVHEALQAQGIKVPRDKVQRLLRKMNPTPIPKDPGQVKAPPTKRSRRTPVDNVPWVNSLWHIDGFRKLIHWKFVIHACIDNKTRLVTFIKVADNNEADTVLANFCQATKEFGWPSRVRANAVGGNTAVRDEMERVRGELLHSIRRN